jgi:glycerol-3-phosphate O-acyltransferase
LPCPRTIAGSNLLTGIIGRLTKLLTGIDMMKWGAIPMKRGSFFSRDLLNLCREIEARLRSNKPVLAFPEMEISSDGKKTTIKTGRAYLGKIRKFGSAVFSPAINVSKEGRKVYIVPISVSYDFVAEDTYFGKLTKADKMKKSENSLAALAGKLYYALLEAHFFYNMYSLGRGNIYIEIGEPILVKPNSSKKELAQLAQKEAARCSRITMPALVSYAISRGATSRDELQKSVGRYASMLKDRNVNFHPALGLNKSIDHTLETLTEQKIISNRNGISVKKPEIISYYVNTIMHHLDYA